VIEYDNIIVRVQDMPPRVKGFVRKSPDGMHNIYLNSRLTYEAMTNAFLHELEHIQRNDLDTDKPITELEG